MSWIPSLVGLCHLEIAEFRGAAFWSGAWLRAPASAAFFLVGLTTAF